MLNPQAQQRVAVYARHREQYRQLFAADGCDQANDPGRSREWLWHAFAFLDGDADDVALANQVMERFPDIANHFNPVAAAALLLHHSDRLTDKAATVLRRIVEESCAEVIDYGLAIAGVTNFSAMFAFVLAAASRLIDTYPAPFRNPSVPEVYNRFRLRQCALNMLHLMKRQTQRDGLIQEFNSPTYTPITLWGLAQIVNWSDCPTTKNIAAELERRVWSEMLALHHPRLFQNTGPHSRAYLVDHVGHATNWKTLCLATGIDDDRPIVNWLYEPQPGQVTSGDWPFRHAMTCWLLRADYHLPIETLAAFRERQFPYVHTAGYRWHGKGFVSRDGKVTPNVEGDYITPGGEGVAQCLQAEDFAIASMSRTYTALNQPCKVIYRLEPRRENVIDVRHATLVMLTEALTATESTPALRNHGEFFIDQDGSVVRGHVQPYAWALPHTPEGDNTEISFNLLFSEHAVQPVQCAQIDGVELASEDVRVHADWARFVIEDSGMMIVLSVKTEVAVTYSLDRRHGWLRCRVTASDLTAMRVDFELSIQAKSPAEELRR